jgi:hypothetical protein
MFRVASKRTLYSALVEDRETEGCNLLNHAMGACPSLYMILEVERRESTSPAQSASVKINRFPGFCEG